MPRQSRAIRSGLRPLRACLVAAPAFVLLLSCATDGPAPRDAEVEPAPRREAPPAAVDPVTPEQACIDRLRRKGAAFERVPDLEEPNGCRYRNAVQLTSVDGMEFTKPLVLQCPLAEKVTDWLKESVRPAAKELLDAEITKVVTFQGYSCRGARGRRWGGQAFRLSQHAYGNAIDVAGFHLASGVGPDGTANGSDTVSVQRDWRADNPRRTLLHRIALAGCEQFSKALTPDYDWYHRHHLHLDLAEDRLCGYGDRFRRPPPPARPPPARPQRKRPDRPIAVKPG